VIGFGIYEMDITGTSHKYPTVIIIFEVFLHLIDTHWNGNYKNTRNSCQGRKKWLSFR
jgi:hypothetical protein